MRFVLTFLSSVGVSAVCVSGLTAFAASPAALLDPLPVRFEPNPGIKKTASGKGSPEVQWSARGLGYAFLFTADATLLHVGDRSVKLTFPGSSAAANFDAVDRMA